MPVIGKTGQSNAQGIVIGPGAPTVFADGTPVSIEKDVVFTHGEAPHAAAILPVGNPTVRAGINQAKASVTFNGTPATCGHPLMGMGTVFVGFAISSPGLAKIIGIMGAANTAFAFGGAQVIGSAGESLGTVSDVMRGS